MLKQKRGPVYLDDCQHPLIRDWMGADGEVSRGVSTDDAVDCIPVGAVGLISVHHCEVGGHNIHLVLWDLPRKLQKRQRRGREWRRRKERQLDDNVVGEAR